MADLQTAAFLIFCVAIGTFVGTLATGVLLIGWLLDILKQAADRLPMIRRKSHEPE